MMRYNQLTIEVYSSGTTRINDPSNELATADSLRFSTGYPGGLYLEASFRVARDVVRWWAVNGAQRVVLRNGLTMVYEGWINDLERSLTADGQYINVNAVGGWSRFLMSRRWRKRWADQRYSDDVWVYDTVTPRTYVNSTGTYNLYADGGGHDHNKQLKIYCDISTWTAKDFASCRYTMPPGEVIRKINYTYKLVGSNMALRFYNATNGWGTIATSAGSTSVIQSYTPATPCNSIELQLITANTVRIDDVNARYGYLQNLTVYGGEAAANAVNLTQVARDVVTRFTDLNSDTQYIGSNTKDLTPFIADDYPTLADILTQAASFGDANNDRWAYGCLGSERAATPNGKPVLYIEEQPALTDYDYAVTMDEGNVVAPFTIVANWDDLYNYVIIEYQDAEGITQYITPADEATLQDATSIAAYGQRDALLSVGDATADLALANGQRLLAARKDPQWKVTTPIRLKGYIRAKDGQRTPVSRLTAGNRLKIEDFVTNLSGSGLTFLISHTTYEDAEETVNISIGPPDDLIYPYFAFAEEAPEDPLPPERQGGRGGRRGLNEPVDDTWDAFQYGYGNRRRGRGRSYNME